MTNKSITADQQPTTNSQQIALLKKHFANCFDKHGSFIPDKLQEIVQTSGLSLSKESYSLNWLGKSYARLLANENIHTLLKADTVHNAKAPHATSQNLLIKGDNLEVLKHLMGAYSEQVKMIYIDPPYNTGSDGFVYQDDRKFTVEQLSSLAGIDEDEAKRILEFTSSSSNSHSAWLTFMYPRLYLAKQLLRDDGVIFISIDDNEQAQLKVLCDEVFGEENFLGCACRVSKKASNQGDYWSPSFDYVLTYAKSRMNCREFFGGVNYEAYNQIETVGVYAGEKYQLVRLYMTSLDPLRGCSNQRYYIEAPDGTLLIPPGNVFPEIQKNGESIPPESGADKVWRWSKETYLKNKDKIVVKAVKSSNLIDSNGKTVKWNVFTKTYLNEVINNSTAKPNSLIEDHINQNSSHELNVLAIPFSFAKPSSLIGYLVEISRFGNDGIILDFFAGSGTTAHAAMQLNAEDGGNRQFICVQIDEATDPKSEAYKAGYKTIFDITKARIEKAAEKIKTDNPDYQGDLGFKVFETIPMFDKYLDAPDELTENLDLFDIDTLSQDDRHNLLLTWTLRDGIKLGTPFAPVILGDYTVYAAGKTLYFVEPDISLDAVVALLGQLDNNPDFSPSRLVVLGYLLDSKVQREMTEAVKHYNNRKGIVLTLDIRYN